MATSGAASDDVGSSKMRTRGVMNSALAISTICLRPRGSWPTGVSAGSVRSELPADLCDRGRDTAVVDHPPRRGYAPRPMFSAMERWGARLSSCCTTAMPSRRASRGASAATAWPSTRISPLSGVSAPDSRLMSVLLPAPFSPSSAWMRPETRSIETSRSTGIAEECLRNVPRSEDRLLRAHPSALRQPRAPRKGYFFRLLAISSSNSFVS